MTKTIQFHVGGPYISKDVIANASDRPLRIIEDLCKEFEVVEYIWYGLELTAPDGIRTVLNNADKLGFLEKELTSPTSQVELKLLYAPISQTMVYQPLVKKHMMEDSLEKILAEDVYAPPDMILSLIAHNLQFHNGDYEDLPQETAQELITEIVAQKISYSLKSRHECSQREWVNTIAKMWKAVRGFHSVDILEAFFEEVEKLQMYNIHYFVITNQKNTSVYVGVEASGISLFAIDDKQTPKVSFEWTELSCMEYSRENLILKLREKSQSEGTEKLVFRTSGKFQGYRIGAVVRGMFDNWRTYIRKVDPEFKEMRDQAMKVGEEAQTQKFKEITQNIEKTKQKISKSLEEAKEIDPMAAKRAETVVNKLSSATDSGQDTSTQLYDKLKDINKTAARKAAEESNKNFKMTRKVKTSSDIIYEEQQQAQFTRFQTLNRLRVGNTRSRVEQFESL